MPITNSLCWWKICRDESLGLNLSEISGVAWLKTHFNDDEVNVFGGLEDSFQVCPVLSETFGLLLNVSLPKLVTIFDFNGLHVKPESTTIQ